MPLSREQIYNDLNGAEAKEILITRFAARLNEIALLQRHLTLPRVRMKLSVSFELYADQSASETHTIEDDFTIRTAQSEESISRSPLTSPIPRAEAPIYRHELEFEDLIDASPQTGDPPDKIREESGLPIPTPVRNRVTHQTADMPETVQLTEGVTISRVNGGVGPSPSRGATIVNQDFGPARGRSDNQYPDLSKNRGRAADPAPIQPFRERDFRDK